LILIAVVVVVAVNSSLFSARTIEVTGAGSLGRDNVLALAGLSSSTNLLKMSPGAVGAHLEASPWIKSASVHRAFPSTVTIDVVVRTPVAEIKSGSKSFATVADDGTILATVRQDPGLPLLAGGPAPGPVGSVAGGEYAVATAAAGTFDTWLSGRIDSVLLGHDGITLRLDDGTLVTWGSAGDEAMKADDLEGILQWADTNHATIRSIDVSAPHAPAAKVAGGHTATIPTP
jgi:cell division protein FtsQ